MFHLNIDLKYGLGRFRLELVSACLATAALVGCGGGDTSPSGATQLSEVTTVQTRPIVAANTVIASTNSATQKLEAIQCARLAKAHRRISERKNVEQTRDAVRKDACAASHELETEVAG